MIKRVLALAAGLSVLLATGSASAAEQAAQSGPPVQVTGVTLEPGVVTQTISVGRMERDEEPNGIVVSTDGRHVYVLNIGARAIIEVPANLSARGIKSIHAAFPPLNAAVTPNGKLLYVSLWGSPKQVAQPGSVAVIRTSDFRIIKYIEVPFAGNLVMAPNGKTVYVTSWKNGRAPQSVTPIRTATNTAGRAIPVASYQYEPIRMSITPDGRYVLVLSQYSQPGGTRDTGILTAIRAATGKVRNRLNVGSGPFDLVVAPNSRHVYVTSQAGLTAISVATDTASRPVNVGLYPNDLAITPDSKTVYVENSLNQVVPVSADTGTVGPAIDISGPNVISGNDGTMAISPATKVLYVLIDDFNGAPGIVVTIDTVTNSTDADQIHVGANPTRIVLSPDGRKAYVLGF